MSKKRRQFAQESLSNALDRLKEGSLWFPYPCIISFFLSLLLISHILVGLNPRLGNPANILPFKAEPSKEGAIWFSVSLKNTTLIFTTSDRKVFRWSLDSNDNTQIKLLKDYLKNQIERVSLTATLSKSLSHIQSMVVFAVDQRVTVKHLRPILYILAEVGISEYAFETIQPVQFNDLADISK